MTTVRTAMKKYKNNLDFWSIHTIISMNLVRLEFSIFDGKISPFVPYPSLTSPQNSPYRLNRLLWTQNVNFWHHCYRPSLSEVKDWALLWLNQLIDTLNRKIRLLDRNCQLYICIRGVEASSDELFMCHNIINLWRMKKSKANSWDQWINKTIINTGGNIDKICLFIGQQKKYLTLQSHTANAYNGPSQSCFFQCLVTFSSFWNDQIHMWSTIFDSNS